MSTATKYAPETNAQPPRCPYCSQPLPEVSCYSWSMQVAIGISMMLCMYCPNTDCRKIIGTQIMIIPHAEEQSGLVRPS